MRKIFAYILTALAITACTSEENFIEEEAQELPLDGICVSFEKPIPANMPGSRSALVYDKFGTSTAPVFEWGDNNLLAFPLNVENIQYVQPIEFKQTGQGNASSREFIPVTNSVSPLVGGRQYVAFYLNNVLKGDINGYTVPVSFKNQNQTGHVDMRHYFDNPISTDNHNVYMASERAASAHLSQFDYLCSEPATAYDKGGIRFSLKRMSVIVRFYIKYPAANMVYTDLQLYNESKKFTLDATIDVSAKTMTTKSADDATSHVMTLKFGQETSPGVYEGFDIGESGNENPFYKYNGTNAYLIAYMMLAPINLKEAEKQSELYLIAHEKGNKEAKHYYKATLGTKPDLLAGQYFQWAPGSGRDPDTPIEFTETTIQKWEQANGIDNGDGNGTGGW